ncbi:MAG: SH3 domain-containing protein [Chloroflexi bacterium]|nr:SH3 domain-containing protein [Chloroflexota bacterium]
MARNLLLVVLMLLLATLACSLTRDGEEEEEPTATPNIATLRAATVQSGSGAGNTDQVLPPLVEILDIVPGEQVEVNQPVTLNVSAQHEESVTRITLRVMTRQTTFSADEVTFAGEGIAQAELSWTPDETGSYTLEVIAFHETIASPPTAVNVQVVEEGALPTDGEGEPPEALGPCYVTTVTTLRARTGPGTGFGQIMTLDEGERLEVTGRNADTTGQTWFQVNLPNGRSGWVNSYPDFVQAEGGCSERDVDIVQP